MDLRGFPVFTGSNVESWIDWLEHYFVSHHFLDDNKLNLSQALMEGDAYEWLHRCESFQSWNEMKRELWFQFESPPRMVLSPHICNAISEEIQRDLVPMLQECLKTLRTQIDRMSDSVVDISQRMMKKMEMPIKEELPKPEILLPKSMTPLGKETTSDDVTVKGECASLVPQRTEFVIPPIITSQETTKVLPEKEISDDNVTESKREELQEVVERDLPTQILCWKEDSGVMNVVSSEVTNINGHQTAHQVFVKMTKRRKKRKKRHKTILEQMQKITSAYMVFDELSSTRNLHIQLPDFTVITPIAAQLQPTNMCLGYKAFMELKVHFKGIASSEVEILSPDCIDKIALPARKAVDKDSSQVLYLLGCVHNETGVPSDENRVLGYASDSKLQEIDALKSDTETENAGSIQVMSELRDSDPMFIDTESDIGKLIFKQVSSWTWEPANNHNLWMIICLDDGEFFRVELIHEVDGVKVNLLESLYKGLPCHVILWVKDGVSQQDLQSNNNLGLREGQKLAKFMELQSARPNPGFWEFVKNQEKVLTASATTKTWIRLSYDGVDPTTFIGLQCKVFWPLDAVWDPGSIIGYNVETKHHIVNYADGDGEVLSPRREKIKFLISRDEMELLNMKFGTYDVAINGQDYHALVILAASFEECQDFEPKDIIWAKLPGHAMWPAIIVDESFIVKRKGLNNKASGGRSVLVQFFGTHDFARIQVKQAVSFLKVLLSRSPLKCKQSSSSIERLTTEIKDLHAELDSMYDHKDVPHLQVNSFTKITSFTSACVLLDMVEVSVGLFAIIIVEGHDNAYHVFDEMPFVPKHQIRRKTFGELNLAQRLMEDKAGVWLQKQDLWVVIHSWTKMKRSLLIRFGDRNDPDRVKVMASLLATSSMMDVTITDANSDPATQAETQGYEAAAVVVYALIPVMEMEAACAYLDALPSFLDKSSKDSAIHREASIYADVHASFVGEITHLQGPLGEAKAESLELRRLLNNEVELKTACFTKIEEITVRNERFGEKTQEGLFQGATEALVVNAYAPLRSQQLMISETVSSVHKQKLRKNWWFKFKHNTQRQQLLSNGTYQRAWGQAHFQKGGVLIDSMSIEGSRYPFSTRGFTNGSVMSWIRRQKKIGNAQPLDLSENKRLDVSRVYVPLRI